MSFADEGHGPIRRWFGMARPTSGLTRVSPWDIVHMNTRPTGAGLALTFSDEVLRHLPDAAFALWSDTAGPGVVGNFAV
jgi:hypothetical protein